MIINHIGETLDCTNWQFLPEIKFPTYIFGAVYARIIRDMRTPMCVVWLVTPS